VVRRAGIEVKVGPMSIIVLFSFDVAGVLLALTLVVGFGGGLTSVLLAFALVVRSTGL
jgi:hypothetical protein